MKTATGSFGIGVRRGWSEWMKDLDGLLPWLVQNGLECLDVGAEPAATLKKVREAGLQIGSVDLPAWKEMISADAAKRTKAVSIQSEFIEETFAAIGPANYFVVMLPEDDKRSRADNFRDMVESYGQVAPVLEKTQSKIVIEGWPGPGALCCTPETLRALFKEVPAAVGINFDPSHLLRMGIDPGRFLEEFADRVYHAHAKDTLHYPELQYDLGTEQPATFAKGHGFGSARWRYTIPGDGVANWTALLAQLKAAGYRGFFSVELEDENYNGTMEGEQKGILASATFLAKA